jgi:hypothetical protein
MPWLFHGRDGWYRLSRQIANIQTPPINFTMFGIPVTLQAVIPVYIRVEGKVDGILELTINNLMQGQVIAGLEIDQPGQWSPRMVGRASFDKSGEGVRLKSSSTTQPALVNFFVWPMPFVHLSLVGEFIKVGVLTEARYVYTYVHREMPLSCYTTTCEYMYNSMCTIEVGLSLHAKGAEHCAKTHAHTTAVAQML